MLTGLESGRARGTKKWTGGGPPGPLASAAYV